MVLHGFCHLPAEMACLTETSNEFFHRTHVSYNGSWITTIVWSEINCEKSEWFWSSKTEMKKKTVHRVAMTPTLALVSNFIHRTALRRTCPRGRTQPPPGSRQTSSRACPSSLWSNPPHLHIPKTPAARHKFMNQD